MAFDRVRGLLRTMFRRRRNESLRTLLPLLIGRYVGPELRQTVRHACTAPVVAVPLDGTGKPIDEAVSQTLLDVSEGGVGLIGSQEIAAEFLLIDFSLAGAAGVQTIVRKAWSHTCGGYTKTGCAFLNVQPGEKTSLIR